MWLRVGEQFKPPDDDIAIFGTLDAAVAAARPGDTIVIAPGQKHGASNLRISKPLCLVCSESLVCLRKLDILRSGLRARYIVHPLQYGLEVVSLFSGN
jgi:hypothetical protein